MDLMINPTITKFAQKVDGEITELKLGAKQEDAYAQIYQKGAESGGGSVENNKSATIDVSAYSAPVEVTPTSGKTSMKKATITLSNIPSPSPATSVTFYAWAGETTPNSTWGFTLSETPSVNDYVFEIDRDGYPVSSIVNANVILSVSENTITIEYGEDTEVLTRLSDGDLTYPKSSS